MWVGGKRGGTGRAIVAGAVERKGKVVARIIERADEITLAHFTREAVSTKSAWLLTMT